MFLLVFIFLFVLPGCVSYPEFMDKKLEVTKTSYRLDGTVESVTVTEHTPSTMGQQAISNAKVDLVVPNCTFNMEALSEIGEVAFAMGMAAGIQMNPCLNTAGDVLESGFENAGDTYATGNISNSTSYADSATANAGSANAEGAVGGSSTMGASGGAAASNVTIGVGNSTGVSGDDALTSSGQKANNIRDNAVVNDQDGLNQSTGTVELNPQIGL